MKREAEWGAMFVFVPDKRSPLTGGHGGVRVQPQTLCTKEQKQWARRIGADNNEMEEREQRETDWYIKQKDRGSET